MATLIILLIMIMLPTFAYQYYAYTLYCKNSEITRPWCINQLPDIYSFVQSHYWYVTKISLFIFIFNNLKTQRNVGFLKYYEIKQIPNFILALPVLLLTFCGLWKYFTFDIKRLYTLGIRNQNLKITHPYFSSCLTLFMFHWLLLALISVFFVHIQVSTRFIFSQCISIYWYMAYLVMKNYKFRYIIVFYMFIYNILGIILFPTFYPWT